MLKCFTELLLFAAIICCNCWCHATGFLGMDRWLDDGGKASANAPEFYWADEVKRIAVPFKPREQRLKVAFDPDDTMDFESRNAAIKRFTEEIDIKEFVEALSSGRITVKDPENAKNLHIEARKIINQTQQSGGDPPRLEEIDTEFSAYHRGALCFARQEYPSAIRAWRELLGRPTNQRHYRTLWATFMIGKAALKCSDYTTAIKSFQQTRQLAQSKLFADSLALAAESYGWEAHAEWKSGHLERAAQLYLTQMAMGDEGAAVSLKALIPDRETDEGALYHRNTDPSQVLKELHAAAKSPILRRLVTAHILAAESGKALWRLEPMAEEPGHPRNLRAIRWLEVNERIAASRLDDAEYLGWIAYTAGRYQEAGRWLNLANPNAIASLWLKAKLLRRDGKMRDAAELMAVVFQRLFRDAAPPQTRNERLGSNRDLVGYTTVQSAAGDLAGLHLSRGDFLAAMDVFFKGGLWLDAAFVADRILTVDELQKYVDEQSVDDQNLRWLLGRRLLREGKLQVAKPYFPRSQLAIFEQYERRLGEGANLKKPARERARALFEAAWIARYFGMELMGTLAEPDGFVSDGQYDTEELDLQRGREVTSGIEPGEFKPVRLHIAATPEEKLRIQKSAPNPDHRFHYRYLAGEIAWEAALLLPNGSEELADVLNCAGYWIRNDEGKKPDRFFFAIEKRCPKSILGKRVIAKRWFLEPDGPWSAPLKKSFPEH